MTAARRTVTDLPLANLLLGALALIAGAVPSSAQDAAQDLFLDRIDVQRVVVDLVVEKGGRPVTDLRRDEVRLYDEGEQVEILGFSSPGALDLAAGVTQVDGSEPTSPEGEPAGGPTDRGVDVDASRPALVVFLDELHMRPLNRKRVLKSARSAADALIDAGGAVTVVAFDGKLRLVQAATRDKKVLRDLFREEMDNLRVPMMAQLANPMSAIRVIEQDMKNNTQERSERGPGLGNDPCVNIGGFANASADQAAAVVQQSLGGLRLLIGSLGRYRGRKAVLHVSDGIPLIPGLEVFTYATEMCDGTAAEQGIPHAVDTQQFGSGRLTRWDPQAARAEMMARDTTRFWRELAAYANAQQVSLYPIQATGLEVMGSGGVDTARTTMSFTQAALENPRDGLFLAAQETGGEMFVNTNEFGNVMVEAAADSADVYQLTFEPARAEGEVILGKRNLRLEVDRPGVKVRYRRSYSPRTANSELVDYAVSGLLFGQTSNELGVRLAISEPKIDDKGGAQVTVRVDVPLESLALLPIGEDRRGRFSVAISAQQANGRYLPIGHRAIDVRASEVDQTTKSFRYEVELPFRSKGLRLSTAVRDDVAGTRSLRVAQVSVGS